MTKVIKFRQSIIIVFRLFILSSLTQRVFITTHATVASNFRGKNASFKTHNSSISRSSSSGNFFPALNYQEPTNYTLISKHDHSKLSTQANLNTASTFTANAQISLAQQTAYGSWQLYYLDRLNIDCTSLGLSTFQMATSGNNWWYNYVCVTPGFTATTTAYSNIVAVQGGTIPVANIKFFQYLTPYIADCSGVGGAITQIQFQSTNSYANSGFAYQCGVFGSFLLSNCRTVTGTAQSIGVTGYGSGNANYLDREQVACNSNEALQTIKWTYNGDTLITGQYVYTCCQYVPSCAYNYYISSGNCALCPAGQSSSGGAATVCYPIQFNQQAQFSLTQQDTGTWSLYYMDRLNLNCNGLGINYFLFQDSYGSTNYGWYNMKCVSPGFTASTTYSYSNIPAVQGGTVAVLNFKYFQYLTPYIADCR